MGFGAVALLSGCIYVYIYKQQSCGRWSCGAAAVAAVVVAIVDQLYMKLRVLLTWWFGDLEIGPSLKDCRFFLGAFHRRVFCLIYINSWYACHHCFARLAIAVIGRSTNSL